MNTQRSDTQGSSSKLSKHDEVLAVEGLEDLFKWASTMVSEGGDDRARHIRDLRMRRQVLEVVQRVREQEAITRASEEITYLQRRVIAILQKLQERTEEIINLRQILVTQTFALEAMDKLKEEVGRLHSLETHIDAYHNEQQELLNALCKLKKERDFLDELLGANEQENGRSSKLDAGGISFLGRRRSSQTRSHSRKAASSK